MASNVHVVSDWAGVCGMGTAEAVLATDQAWLGGQQLALALMADGLHLRLLHRHFVVCNHRF